jgi:hypothetical protein
MLRDRHLQRLVIQRIKYQVLPYGIIATDRQVECIHHCLTLSPHIAQAVGALAHLWATKGYLQFPDGLLEWLHCHFLAIQLRIYWCHTSVVVAAPVQQ